MSDQYNSKNPFGVIPTYFSRPEESDNILKTQHANGKTSRQVVNPCMNFDLSYKSCFSITGGKS